MPSPKPPRWKLSESFRETTLILIDRPKYRKALRQVGRLIYHMAVELGRFECSGGETTSHAELRAAAAELRFIEGFLGSLRKGADESLLEPADENLAIFAGHVAPQVGALAASIEERL